MSFADHMLTVLELNRERTLVTLDAIAQMDDPQAVLGWRPGPGRAHIAWQLMHIAVTEELFATERFVEGATPQWPDLCERFRGGSTPDDNIPSLDHIRETLAASREHLQATVSAFTEASLHEIPAGLLTTRGWTRQKALLIINWHECHHQGQAHLTLNLFKNRQPS